MAKGATREELAQIRLISLETPPGGPDAVEIGEMVSVAVVEASNIIRDVRELVTNALGGRMKRYEALLEIALKRGEARFREELLARGYDGALGVRFAHPTVVDGGAELVVYGTGFRWRPRG